MKAKTNNGLIKIGVLSIVLLGTTALILVTLSNKRAEQAFAKEIAQAKSLGLGTGMNHFIRQVDPTQNAAAIMEKQLSATPKNVDWQAHKNGTLTLQEILDQFATLESDAQIAAQAALLPEWYPERNWNDGIDSMVFPEFATLKAWTYYFANRARAKSMANDFKGAEEDFLTAARLTAHAASEDTNIGILVHSALNSIITAELLEAVQFTNGNPAMIAIARKTLSHHIPITFQRFLAGETAIQIEISQNWYVYTNKETDFHLENFSSLFGTPVNPNRLGSLILQYLNEVTKAYNEAESPQDKINACQTIPVPEVPGWMGEYVALRAMLPIFDNALHTCFQDQSQHQIALSALNLWEFKNKNGRFPQPNEFTPLNDIYTQKPLHYRLENNLPLLYSVGENFQDDNGHEETDQIYHPAPNKPPIRGR